MEFENVLEKCCGIDVHKDNIVVSIIGKGIKKTTKTFLTFTEDLKSCQTWLLENGIEYGAMESTGVYWKPVFHILADKLKLILVNARHIKNVPGKKTDVKDSEWIAKLLLSGLLKGSFIPEEKIRNSRDLYRYKTKLINQRADEKNRIQRVLEDANIKLSSVVSDVFGKTARALIQGLLNNKNIDKLIDDNYHGKLKASKKEIKKALTGRLTEHHKFIIQEIYAHMAYLDEQILKFENKLDELLETHKSDIKLLSTIPGINKNAATGIIAEIGADMDVFPDEHHLSSWAGMAPGNNESAGKKKSSRITQGNKYLKALLVQCAWAATRTKGTYFSSRYSSLVIRRGKKRALIALGHKSLCSVYHVLSKQEPYKELGAEFLEQRKLNNRISNINRQLKELGCEPVVIMKRTA